MANPYAKMTHKARILIYLRARQPNYISSVEIERQAVDWGAKGQTIDRRCRELRNEGRIQSKMIDGIVWYRLTQSESRLSTLQANAYLHSLDKEFERERQVSLYE